VTLSRLANAWSELVSGC